MEDIKKNIFSIKYFKCVWSAPNQKSMQKYIHCWNIWRKPKHLIDYHQHPAAVQSHKDVHKHPSSVAEVAPTWCGWQGEDSTLVSPCGKGSTPACPMGKAAPQLVTMGKAAPQLVPVGRGSTPACFLLSHRRTLHWKPLPDSSELPPGSTDPSKWTLLLYEQGKMKPIFAKTFLRSLMDLPESLCFTLVEVNISTLGTFLRIFPVSLVESPW